MKLSSSHHPTACQTHEKSGCGTLAAAGGENYIQDSPYQISAAFFLCSLGTFPLVVHATDEYQTLNVSSVLISTALLLLEKIVCCNASSCIYFLY